MKRTKYFADTAPGQEQLNNHVDVTIEGIKERFLSESYMGIVSGMVVTPDTIPTNVAIAPGTGFVPNGERINVPSAIRPVSLADYTLGAKNYIVLKYTESEDTPLPERFHPIQHNTIVREGYSVEVLTASQWASLTTTQREERLLVAIVTAKGVGQPITTTDIQNAVLPGRFLTASQPMNITGVLIVAIDQTTPVGFGTLSFTYAGGVLTMTWASPGGAVGAAVNVSVVGEYTLTSAAPDSKTIKVSVDPTATPTVSVTDSIQTILLYDLDVPIQSAQDNVHRMMIGTGFANSRNPHGLSLEDLGVTETGQVREHQDRMHSNGIYKRSDSGVLMVTAQLASGSHLNDFLSIQIPAGNDSYYVKGYKHATVAPSEVDFDDAGTQLELYEVYIDKEGNIGKSLRAYIAAPRSVGDGIAIIAMDDDIPAGTYGNGLWFYRVGLAGQMRWNGGPIQNFTIVSGDPLAEHWLVLTGQDGRKITVHIHDSELPAPGTYQDNVEVQAGIDQDEYFLIHQVAFDGEEGTPGEMIVPGYITDRRIFGTLGSDAEADSLDRLYEEEGWAQRLYTSGVLYGMDITNPSGVVVAWTPGEAYIAGKRFKVTNGTVSLATDGTNYIYVDEDGQVVVSLTDPSLLISDKYPTTQRPYALLATAVKSGGSLSSLVISRKAPDLVVGDIYQQGTSRYMRATNMYPHAGGCGLWRDGACGNYVMQQATAPDWSTCYDKFGSIRDGGFWGCHPGAGYGVTGYGCVAGGGGVQGIGHTTGVYGYSRNATCSSSGCGGYFYAPYAGGYGVFGCGYSVGGAFYASDVLVAHIGLAGCALSSIAGSYGVYGQSGYGGIYGYGSTIGIMGCGTGAGANGVLGYALGNGGIGGWFGGDVLGVCGRGAGTGSTGVYGCGATYGLRGLSYQATGGFGVYGCALGAGSVGGCFVGDSYGMISYAGGAGAYGVYGCSALGVGVMGWGMGAGSAGVCGRADSATGSGVAGYSVGGYGVCGWSTNNYAGAFCSANTWGLIGHGTYGVWGCSSGAGYGVLGCALSGVGVYGCATNGYGVSGHASAGGYGVAGSSNSNIGVYGITSGASVGVRGDAIAVANGCGVFGYGTGVGVKGYSTANYSYGGVFEGAIAQTGTVGVCGLGNAYGVVGDAKGTGSTGVYGVASGTGCGVCGYSASGYGVVGASAAGVGVYGYSPNVQGVYGISVANVGVYGCGPYGVCGAACGGGWGVYGQASTGCGVVGNASSSGTGVCGYSASGVGVCGYSAGTGIYAVSGYSPTATSGGVCGCGSFVGVDGCGFSGGVSAHYGLRGLANNGGCGIGVYGQGCASGVCGYSLAGCGVSGATLSGYAGYFNGRVYSTTCIHAATQFFAGAGAGSAGISGSWSTSPAKTLTFVGGILTAVA